MALNGSKWAERASDPAPTEQVQVHYSTGFIGYGFRDNVNGLELTQSERAQFTAGVVYTLGRVGAEVLALCEGIGQWEGVSESCGSITFRLPIDSTITARKATLVLRLATLARRYDQDSIALTFGDTVLVDAV